MGNYPHEVMPLSDAITTKNPLVDDSAFNSKVSNISQNSCNASMTDPTPRENVNKRPIYNSNDENNFAFNMDDDMQELTFDSADDSSVNEPPSPAVPSIRSNFLEYVARANDQFANLTNTEKTAITLLHRLRQTKASLDTYDSVMEWHLRVTGSISDTQKATDSNQFITRDKMFKKLRQRYNLPETKFNNISEIILPHSQALVKIVWHDAEAVMQSLLTDPRIDDDHYLFHDNNPLNSPPNDIKYVKDLNTGRAHTETHKVLINDPTKQILLPVIFYIDGANTGQFVDLPMTAVRISLGIFSRKAHDEDYC